MYTSQGQDKSPIQDSSTRKPSSAGISLTIPQARFNKQREGELIELVTRSANRLSGRLGLRDEDYAKIATGDLIVD